MQCERLFGKTDKVMWRRIAHGRRKMINLILKLLNLEKLKRNPDFSFSQGFLFFLISDLFRLFQMATKVKALSSSDQNT